MKECAKICLKGLLPCQRRDCRQHIEYEEDQNCVLIAVHKNGPMTLREIAPRMGVTFPRVKQIEDQAKKKLNKKMKDYQ